MDDVSPAEPPHLLQLRPRSSAVILWLAFIGNGMTIGLLSGFVTGTLFLPLYGTIAGAAVGLMAGLVLGVMVGPITALVAREGRPVRKVVTDVQRYTVLALAAGWCVYAVVSVLKSLDTPWGWLSIPLGLLLLLPLGVGAAWAAARVVRGAASPEIGAAISDGAYGRVIQLWQVMVASAVPPILYWVCFAIWDTLS
jgi:hypothetical protein